LKFNWHYFYFGGGFILIEIETHIQ